MGIFLLAAGSCNRYRLSGFALECGVISSAQFKVDRHVKISFNGEPLSIDGATTISKILDQFEIDRRQVAVEVNLEIVPRAELDKYVIQDGDRIEVVTLVGGG